MANYNDKIAKEKNNIDSLIYTNYEQNISGDDIQTRLKAVLDTLKIGGNPTPNNAVVVDNTGNPVFKDLELDKKIESIYVDGTTIQGKGTKDSPLSTIQPSELEDLITYGVRFTGNDPDGVRVGNMTYHKTLPLQSQMRRALLNDDGTVNYWLASHNSLLKENGQSAILDGRDGQVMVFMPQFWYKVTLGADYVEYRISPYKVAGYEYSPQGWISAYEASLQRSTSKLSSVVNYTVDYRGGDNTADWDGTYRSLLGRPATDISLLNFEKYALNRGEKWLPLDYDLNKAKIFLFIIEHATLNSQKSFNDKLSSDGYRQGGLGDGVTNLSAGKWSNFNSFRPFIPCGVTNSIGNNTGVVKYSMPEEYDEDILDVYVPSYRGMENPFGHIWEWCSNIRLFIEAEGESKWQINGKSNGTAPRVDGYIKELVGGEIAPSSVGGSSSTYYSDRFFTSIPSSGVSEHGVRFGGAANNDSSAGLFYSDTRDAPSYSAWALGSRLCFK